LGHVPYETSLRPRHEKGQASESPQEAGKVANLADTSLTPARKPKISGGMSGHGDPHDEAQGDGHDEHEHDDDHHAPAPLPEPPTPLWLTFLGVGLFLTAGILFVATRADGKTTAELTAVPSAEPAGSAAAAPAPNPGATAPNPTPGQPAMRPGAAPPNPPTMPGGAARPAGGSKQPGHEGHDHD
jgi:hypothetical protein